jgi:glutamine cyclotransferase
LIPALEPALPGMARIAFMAAMSLAAPSAALAQMSTFQQIGTPEQRREAIAACGHDARLFCQSLKEADGPYAYLTCLELNRRQLTTRCVALLARYGQ